VGFHVAAYDRSRPLVLDPVLAYSTYLGGSGWDTGYAIAVDAAGNAYVTGETLSSDFPTANALQPAMARGSSTAAVFPKLDAAGAAHVTGETWSSDFPTAQALQPTKAGPSATADAFIAKLDASGTALLYSTYLGGSNGNWGNGIAVDAAGNAYVTGLTGSTDFPTVNAVQPAFGGGSSDAFVAKLDPTGSALVYSTYLGGN